MVGSVGRAIRGKRVQEKKPVENKVASSKDREHWKRTSVQKPEKGDI